MTRRTFGLSLSGVTLGAAWHGNSSVLQAEAGRVFTAIAGPRLPDHLLLPADFPASLCERRVYPDCPPDRLAQLVSMLAPHGVHVFPEPEMPSALLLGFDSLHAREQAWNQVNAAPAWHALRNELGPRAAYRFTLYQRAC